MKVLVGRFWLALTFRFLTGFWFNNRSSAGRLPLRFQVCACGRGVASKRNVGPSASEYDLVRLTGVYSCAFLIGDFAPELLTPKSEKIDA